MVSLFAKHIQYLIGDYYSGGVSLCLHKEFVTLCHDSATGGHHDWHKTRLKAYWVNMAQDADEQCKKCTICQWTKPTAPK